MLFKTEPNWELSHWNYYIKIRFEFCRKIRTKFIPSLVFTGLNVYECVARYPVLSCIMICNHEDVECFFFTSLFPLPFTVHTLMLLECRSRHKNKNHNSSLSFSKRKKTIMNSLALVPVTLSRSISLACTSHSLINGNSPGSTWHQYKYIVMWPNMTNDS